MKPIVVLLLLLSSCGTPREQPAAAITPPAVEPQPGPHIQESSIASFTELEGPEPCFQRSVRGSSMALSLLVPDDEPATYVVCKGAGAMLVFGYMRFPSTLDLTEHAREDASLYYDTPAELVVLSNTSMLSGREALEVRMPARELYGSGERIARYTRVGMSLYVAAIHTWAPGDDAPAILDSVQFSDLIP